jgi:hypothetical protein
MVECLPSNESLSSNPSVKKKIRRTVEFLEGERKEQERRLLIFKEQKEYKCQQKERGRLSIGVNMDSIMTFVIRSEVGNLQKLNFTKLEHHHTVS